MPQYLHGIVSESRGSVLNLKTMTVSVPCAFVSIDCDSVLA